MKYIKFKAFISIGLLSCGSILGYILNSRKPISVFDDNIIENNKPLPISKKEVSGYTTGRAFIENIFINGSVTDNSLMFNNKAVAASIIQTIMQHDSLKNFEVSDCANRYKGVLFDIVESSTCIKEEQSATNYGRITFELQAPKDVRIEVTGNLNITINNGVLSWELSTCQMCKKTPIYSH